MNCRELTDLLVLLSLIPRDDVKSQPCRRVVLMSADQPRVALTRIPSRTTLLMPLHRSLLCYPTDVEVITALFVPPPMLHVVPATSLALTQTRCRTPHEASVCETFVVSGSQQTILAAITKGRLGDAEFTIS